jgi:hypothetical protein
MSEVTLVITSCGRVDLLEETVKSFFKYNTYPLKRTLIIEDGDIEDFSNIERHIVGDYEIIKNETNLGQFQSIDKVYSMVDTEFLFHCEDDWEFLNEGFIEASLDIFNSWDNKEYKLFGPWVCQTKIVKTNGRRVYPEVYETKGGIKYQIINSGIAMGGYTLNPGLRRTSDCMLEHPYNEIKNDTVDREAILARRYIKKRNFRAVHIVDTNYCVHLGYGRHISRKWEK